jgi:hypothetical protein
MWRFRVGLTFVAALAVLLMTSSVEAAASQTCSGGTIAAGTYSSLTVTGNCSIPSGTVNVQGSLTVGSNAVLDAAVAGTTVNVSGSIQVGRGAILVFGCGPDIGCSTPTSDRVGGSIAANQALAVILHNNTIAKNVSFQGGGGGTSCNTNPTLAAIVGFPAPPYMDISSNTIGGNVSESNERSCWSGVTHNGIGGNVSVTNNTFGDPDANEVVSNVIGGNLGCSGNSPAAQIGDSGGSPNQVQGNKSGECVRL